MFPFDRYRLHAYATEPIWLPVADDVRTNWVELNWKGQYRLKLNFITLLNIYNIGVDARQRSASEQLLVFTSTCRIDDRN